MNDTELNIIQSRADKASVGPWRTFDAFKHERKGKPERKYWVWKDNNSGHYNAICECNCEDEGGSEQEILDAEFIAAARTDIPDLVTEIRRLKLEINGLLDNLEGTMDL